MATPIFDRRRGGGGASGSHYRVMKVQVNKTPVLGSFAAAAAPYSPPAAPGRGHTRPLNPLSLTSLATHDAARRVGPAADHAQELRRSETAARSLGLRHQGSPKSRSKSLRRAELPLDLGLLSQPSVEITSPRLADAPPPSAAAPAESPTARRKRGLASALSQNTMARRHSHSRKSSVFSVGSESQDNSKYEIMSLADTWFSLSEDTTTVMSDIPGIRRELEMVGMSELSDDDVAHAVQRVSESFRLADDSKMSQHAFNAVVQHLAESCGALEREESAGEKGAFATSGPLVGNSGADMGTTFLKFADGHGRIAMNTMLTMSHVFGMTPAIKSEKDFDLKMFKTFFTENSSPEEIFVDCGGTWHREAEDRLVTVESLRSKDHPPSADVVFDYAQLLLGDTLTYHQFCLMIYGPLQSIRDDPRAVGWLREQVHHAATLIAIIDDPHNEYVNTAFTRLRESGDMRAAAVDLAKYTLFRHNQAGRAAPNKRGASTRLDPSEADDPRLVQLKHMGLLKALRALGGEDPNVTEEVTYTVADTRRTAWVALRQPELALAVLETTKVKSRVDLYRNYARVDGRECAWQDEDSADEEESLLGTHSDLGPASPSSTRLLKHRGSQRGSIAASTFGSTRSPLSNRRMSAFSGRGGDDREATRLATSLAAGSPRTKRRSVFCGPPKSPKSPSEPVTLQPVKETSNLQPTSDDDSPQAGGASATRRKGAITETSTNCPVPIITVSTEHADGPPGGDDMYIVSPQTNDGSPDDADDDSDSFCAHAAAAFEMHVNAQSGLRIGRGQQVMMSRAAGGRGSSRRANDPDSVDGLMRDSKRIMLLMSSVGGASKRRNACVGDVLKAAGDVREGLSPFWKTPTDGEDSPAGSPRSGGQQADVDHEERYRKGSLYAAIVQRRRSSVRVGSAGDGVDSPKSPASPKSPLTPHGFILNTPTSRHTDDATIVLQPTALRAKVQGQGQAPDGPSSSDNKVTSPPTFAKFSPLDITTPPGTGGKRRSWATESSDSGDATTPLETRERDGSESDRAPAASDRASQASLFGVAPLLEASGAASRTSRASRTPAGRDSGTTVVSTAAATNASSVPNKMCIDVESATFVGRSDDIYLLSPATPDDGFAATPSRERGEPGRGGEKKEDQAREKEKGKERDREKDRCGGGGSVTGDESDMSRSGRSSGRLPRTCSWSGRRVTIARKWPLRLAPVLNTQSVVSLEGDDMYDHNIDRTVSPISAIEHVTRQGLAEVCGDEIHSSEGSCESGSPRRNDPRRRQADGGWGRKADRGQGQAGVRGEWWRQHPIDIDPSSPLLTNAVAPPAARPARGARLGRASPTPKERQAPAPKKYRKQRPRQAQQAAARPPSAMREGLAVGPPSMRSEDRGSRVSDPKTPLVVSRSRGRRVGWRRGGTKAAEGSRDEGRPRSHTPLAPSPPTDARRATAEGGARQRQRNSANVPPPPPQQQPRPPPTARKLRSRNLHRPSDAWLTDLMKLAPSLTKAAGEKGKPPARNLYGTYRKLINQHVTARLGKNMEAHRLKFSGYTASSLLGVGPGGGGLGALVLDWKEAGAADDEASEASGDDGELFDKVPKLDVPSPVRKSVLEMPQQPY